MAQPNKEKKYTAGSAHMAAKEGFCLSQAMKDGLASVLFKSASMD